MSKKTAVTTIDPTFSVALEPTAPQLAIDPMAVEHFDWKVLYPSNFFNTDDLEDMRQELGGWPVYTPVAVTVEQVQDPEHPDPNKMADLVIAFAETSTRLVCNRTRCKLLASIAGTRDPRRWVAALGRLELFVGVEKSMSKMPQILVRPAPDGDD